MHNFTLNLKQKRSKGPTCMLVDSFFPLLVYYKLITAPMPNFSYNIQPTIRCKEIVC